MVHSKDLGARLPLLRSPIPGPATTELFASLGRHEAPGVNTLVGGQGALAWQEARGANVVDPDGNVFIDLTAGFGVAAVGHRHPKVIAAIEGQAGRLIHGLGDVHGHPLRAELAAELVRRAPVEDPLVYFAVSGADAVEIALKTALLATRRQGIVAFEPSYHGLTLGALGVTSRPAFRDPFAAHLHRHVRRLPFGCPLSDLEEALAGPPVAAVVAEPIVGREGVLLPPQGWLKGVAESCRRHGALFVADEIFTGFGRTGRWFAVEEEGVRPDLLCCGKALGGGLPIAAVIGRGPLMAAWDTPGEALHTATFVAHPLACASALATLSVLDQEGLPDRARHLGEWIRHRLRSFSDSPTVREVRGRGLLWGVELRQQETAKTWAREALHRGVIALAGGPEGRVLQIVPPLVITREQLSESLRILDETLPREEP